MTKRTIALAILFLFATSCASLSTVKETEETKDEPGNLQSSSTASEETPGYVLGVGDEVNIVVWKHDDLSRALRIDSSGKIFYPLVGDIHAEGLTGEDLRVVITEGLSDYIQDPQVNVEIVKFRSSKVYIMGEVYRPGVLLMEDSTNIMDALLQVGGPTRDANKSKIIMIRNHPDHLELQAINLKSLLEDGDKTQLVSLQKGDIIYVPPSFIANVDRFFEHVGKIFSPLVDVGRTFVLGDEIKRIFTGERGVQRTIIVR